jgi:hypothetical protein
MRGSGFVYGEHLYISGHMLTISMLFYPFRYLFLTGNYDDDSFLASSAPPAGLPVYLLCSPAHSHSRSSNHPFDGSTRSLRSFSYHIPAFFFTHPPACPFARPAPYARSYPPFPSFSDPTTHTSALFGPPHWLRSLFARLASLPTPRCHSHLTHPPRLQRNAHSSSSRRTTQQTPTRP